MTFARGLSPVQQENWTSALYIFGPPPNSLAEWRQSTTYLLSQGGLFLFARRAARVLYLRMCVADVNTPELFTTHEEAKTILAAWDQLRKLHNDAAPVAAPVEAPTAATVEAHTPAPVEAPAGAKRKQKNTNKAKSKMPPSGRFAAVNTREVQPRAMSKAEVRGIVGRFDSPQTPIQVTLPNKAAFAAAVGADNVLSQRLSDRYYLTLPSKQEIVAAIPPNGITLHDLLLIFAPRLCLKTVANFVERVFQISAMDPVSHKLQPVMSLNQAETLAKGKYRDFAMRAARHCQPTQTTGNLKYDAFKQHGFEAHFFGQMREYRILKPRGRKEKIWYFSSEAADERTLKKFEPLMLEAERKRKEEDAKVAKQYMVLEEPQQVEAEKRRQEEELQVAKEYAMLEAEKKLQEEEMEVMKEHAICEQGGGPVERKRRDSVLDVSDTLLGIDRMEE
ncbi:uncharacterized protein RCC_07868 [Ramularia collo-cygni]|uniref:Uncharacterized protein n=1 Tax=Ramularia collo-cygni TaxID=112498 RepID=A0A2D3VIX2_9PEZI|nr:uncharacterized protein RCC_07868 [Ramularia collo-cygni]CZT21999.1 uncharacterized protein RCC_07868 [Ramularia collo-cygni]